MEGRRGPPAATGNDDSTRTTPMTISAAKRRRINKRNSSKSTGPTSPEGKLRASMNSTKHGLRTESLPLPHEDAEAVRALFQKWVDFYQPRTPGENALLELAATAQVQIGRTLVFQAGHLKKATRTAKKRFDEAREKEVADFVTLLKTDPAAAVRGLRGTSQG